jgi:hypothetical protein
MGRLSATFAGLLISAVLPLAAQVNQADGGVTYSAGRDGGVSQVLQSIYIPPMVNAPFTAIVHTKWERPIPTGGAITLVNKRSIARDSHGRFLQERWLLVPAGQDGDSRKNLIQIADPEAHTLYNCYVLFEPRHQCVLESFAHDAVTSFRPTTAVTGPLAGGRGYANHEDLGPRTIENVDTVGTRDTITFDVGAAGNDKPFSIVREFWHAPSLGINLISILSDPRIGKQTFTITDVQLGEPDPGLFEIPKGFKVVDARKPEPPAE